MLAEDEDAGPRILCLVGFGRKAVEGVKKALQWVEEKPGIQIQLNILTKNDDFVMEEFSEKRKILILIASFTERNNILGESPDYGELSQVYEKVNESSKSRDDVFVIYAGIPHSTYEEPTYPCLYYSRAEKLTRSQPDLKDLMTNERFLTLSDQYKFQKHQKVALEKGLNIYIDENFYDSSEIASGEHPDLAGVSDPEKEQQIEEWKQELAKLEDEITTLRQVLGSKVRQSNELKRQLGITPMKEFKQDMQQGIKNIKDSETYQKTNAAFKTAGQKTSTAFTTFGAFASRKIGDVRNSNTFKSIEEKVGSAYTNVKTKVSGSKSEQNIAEASGSAPADDSPLVESKPLPEEKVPL